MNPKVDALIRARHAGWGKVAKLHERVAKIMASREAHGADGDADQTRVSSADEACFVEVMRIYF